MPGTLRSLLHRRLWQSLPQGLRRAALFGATALAAPRPSAGARPALPFIVAGALRTASGLGQSARLCHDALAAAGLPVHAIDLTEGLMQPADLPAFAGRDGRQHAGPATLLLHANSALVPLAMLRLGREVLRGAYVVAYWAWELPTAPPEWRHGVPFVHEIWAPSAFTAEAFRPIAAGRPVRIVPHPALAHPLPPQPASGGAQRPFTVLTLFNAASSFARKNPVAAVAAFRQAFGDDPSARLVVKASNMAVYPPGEAELRAAIGRAGNIDLVPQTMTPAEIDALYAGSDVVVSLHRSEGFGLTIAEGMARGRPVVATDWSGSVDFLGAATGLPVAYRLVPARDPQFTYEHADMAWAEPDLAAAAEALRRLRADAGLRERLGRAAATFAGQAFSAQAYAALVRRHLGL